jgi:hypothetical protein
MWEKNHRFVSCWCIDNALPEYYIYRHQPPILWAAFHWCITHCWHSFQIQFLRRSPRRVSWPADPYRCTALSSIQDTGAAVHLIYNRSTVPKSVNKMIAGQAKSCRINSWIIINGVRTLDLVQRLIASPTRAHSHPHTELVKQALIHATVRASIVIITPLRFLAFFWPHENLPMGHHTPGPTPGQAPCP